MIALCNDAVQAVAALSKPGLDLRGIADNLETTCVRRSTDIRTASFHFVTTTLRRAPSVSLE